MLRAMCVTAEAMTSLNWDALPAEAYRPRRTNFFRQASSGAWFHPCLYQPVITLSEIFISTVTSANLTLDVSNAWRYCIAMIKSFRNKETEKIFNRHFSKKIPSDIQHQARRKLVMIDAAPELSVLRIPPGNRLEALKGDRKGQHSIRINDQWRICFNWKAGDAYDVEITDYH